MNRAQTQKRLKPILLQLEDITTELESIVEERTSYADDRSETWEESDNGATYIELTEAIEALKDSIENEATEIEGLLDD